MKKINKFNSFFIKLIKEFTEYKDLPLSLPYGFWISPDGQIELVKQYKHLDVATSIVKSKKVKFKHPYIVSIDRGNYDEFLLKNNWVRVVTGGYASGKLYAQHSIGTTLYPLTNKAKQTILDIAMFYDIKEEDVIFDF